MRESEKTKNGVLKRYCTFSEAEAYILYDVNKKEGDSIVCCGCALKCGAALKFHSRLEVLAHINEHRQHGHSIPYFVDEMLKKEIEEIGDAIE